MKIAIAESEREARLLTALNNAYRNRNAIIEECARHIETFDDYWIGCPKQIERIAEVIRALKDKP